MIFITVFIVELEGTRRNEDLHGVQGVASSNLVAPTNTYES